MISVFTVLYIFMTFSSNVCLVGGVCAIFSFPKMHFIMLYIFMTFSSNVCMMGGGICAKFSFPKMHFIILPVFKICGNVSLATSEQLKHRNSDNLHV